ncbi:hypothetical protein LCGC14_0662830 [marine sediment metagenome]|uniref:Phage major capsid protein n=1 Tax=marine sediment metagenome TaxID=412755 RepID=A0A0F9U1D2_9ZZZZ
MLTNKQLLEKAALETEDFGGSGEARLTVEQAEAFIKIATTPQAMLADVRTVLNNAATWEENRIAFGRILKPASASGVGEQGRLTGANRVAPTTGVVVMATRLFRGEVLVSDSVMEDNTEREGFAGTITSMIAEQCGVDIEDLMINGDTDNDDAFLAEIDGWLKIVTDYNGGSQVHDASGDATFQATLKALLANLPSAFKKDKAGLRFYCSDIVEEAYRDVLSTRGTPLGDLTLEGTKALKYQGIDVKPVPLFPVDDTTGLSVVLLTHKNNLYAGWRRQIVLEPYRDPRDGGTSFIVSTRVDAEVGYEPAAVIATGVPALEIGS